MRRLLIVLGTVLVLACAGVVAGDFTLDQLPFQAAPRQLHVCGRTYVLPSPQRVTRQAIEAQGLTVQAQVRTWQGRRAVWGQRSARSCGLDVFLQVGSDDFRGYNLSGSP